MTGSQPHLLKDLFQRRCRKKKLGRQYIKFTITLYTKRAALDSRGQSRNGNCRSAFTKDTGIAAKYDILSGDDFRSNSDLESQNLMFEINKILQFEVSFCESFTNKIVTDYGLLYYRPDNPLSHDSNHTHILDIHDHPERAIAALSNSTDIRG
jgi:hypothetical protein